MDSWQTFEQYNQHLNNGVAGMVWILLVGTVLVYNAPIPKYHMIQFPCVKIGAPPLWIILSAAALMRLAWINQSLWYDETFTLNVVRGSFERMRPLILSDVHPALGYVVIWLSTHILGFTEFALRAPSLVFGLLSIWIIYRLGLSLNMGSAPSRWAALIFSLAPLHIYQSTEGRAYALLLCLFLYSLLAILENKPGRFLLAGFLPHLHAIGFVYLTVLWFVALFRAEDIRAWSAPLIGAGLIGSLYLPIAMIQANDVRDGFWNGAFSLGDALSYTFDTYFWRRYDALLALVVWGIALPYSFLSLWITRNWKQAPLLLIFYLGVPIAAALISVLFANVYIERTLMPAGLLIVFFWIKAANRLPRFMPYLMSAALVLATGYSLINWNRGELRDNAHYCAGTDMVYVQNNAMAIAWSAYLDQVILWDNPARDDLVQHLTPEAITVSNFRLATLDQLQGDICLIVNISPLNDPAQIEYLKTVIQDNKPYWSKRVTEYPHYIIDIYRIRL